jgi:hypothetical protein
MEDAESVEKLAQHTKDVYAAVGEFAVKFEHVCHAMQTAVATIFKVHGLQNDGLTNAVLSGLTAEPMLRALHAAAMEGSQNAMPDADSALLKKVVKRIQTLTEVRNDIIHRMWFVGWTSTNMEISPTFGSKHKNSSKGAEFRPLYFGPEDFKRHADEAEVLASVVGCLGASFFLKVPFRSLLTADKLEFLDAK